MLLDKKLDADSKRLDKEEQLREKQLIKKQLENDKLLEKQKKEEDKLQVALEKEALITEAKEAINAFNQRCLDRKNLRLALLRETHK